jgi:chromatin structure-remodeling complex subunit RSC9
MPGVINGANGNAGDAHFPHFTAPTSVLPHLQLVHTPRITPGLFAGTKRKHPEINGASHVSVIGAGHTGIGLIPRVVMSLKCGIPEEVDFALTQLVRISFELGDDLRSEHWVGLGTALFEKLQSVVQLVAEHTQDDMVYHAEFATQLEKTYEAALVLRNMALQNENAIHFASMPNTKAILTDVLQLPNMPALAELKTYALDMIDVMAMHIHYPQNDPLINMIMGGLESPDRGILMGSLRVLCRFTVGRDDFNPIGDIPFPMMQRITSLLMLEDDDLVSACLDFLYQYTSNDENVQNLLRPSEGYALIRHLVRLMIYQGITGEQLVYIKAMKKNRPPVHDIPHLPQEIVKDLLTYSEPERATKW